MQLSQLSQLTLRSSQKSFRITSCNIPSRRCLTSGGEILQEGDRALLRLLRWRSETLVLTEPLHPKGKTSTRFGDVDHASIIGRQVREFITTSRRWELRVHLPTLDEYVRMTPRLVTPVYPSDANLIVSLLDLHPTSQAQSTDPPLEILEAGTGHGALTLHLARAIHAANRDSRGPASKIESLIEFMDINTSLHQRNAIIHSLDISAQHSKHASKILKGFRRGLYSNDVEFHVGDVSDWLDKRLGIRTLNRSDSTNNAFLSHILLDLPSSHDHAKKVASALHIDGSLVVFTPSITQIVSWVTEIKKKKLPLALDQILELGHGISGGRQWDVRVVKPRALLRVENTKTIVATDAVQTGRHDGPDGLPTVQDQDDDGGEAAKAAQSSVDDDSGWEVICRPKVGEMVIGGGFLGVWKKMRERSDQVVVSRETRLL